AARGDIASRLRAAARAPALRTPPRAANPVPRLSPSGLAACSRATAPWPAQATRRQAPPVDYVHGQARQTARPRDDRQHGAGIVSAGVRGARAQSEVPAISPPRALRPGQQLVICVLRGSVVFILRRPEFAPDNEIPAHFLPRGERLLEPSCRGQDLVPGFVLG